MSLSVEEYSSLIILTHFIYKAALILTVSRWVLSWALNHRIIPTTISSSSVVSTMIRDHLVLTTYGEIKKSRSVTDTCAVCLVHLREKDLVPELRNCCYVFHKECIDRWVEYEQHHDDQNQNQNHKSCPLCRAPLLSSSQTVKNEPSWAVERILYLFGDDLLM